jgi:predicted dehydrogenase
LSTRLRIGVVGAGLGAAPHFKSLQELSDQVDVAWLHVRQPERLTPSALPPGAQVTARYEDLLEDPSLQAVLILTPPNTHLELVQRAAIAGKHVLLEKPVEISLAKAKELVAVCEQHQVLLAVMLQHRLREASVALAALIASGELGELTGASCSMRWWRPQSCAALPARCCPGRWPRP